MCVRVCKNMHWFVCLCEAGGGVCVCTLALSAAEKNGGISCKASEKTDFGVTYHTNLGSGDCFSQHAKHGFISVENLSCKYDGLILTDV